jgi:hypothetical protein
MASNLAKRRAGRGFSCGGLAVLIVALTLWGCVSGPPYYGPKQTGQQVGYTDQRLDQNRYRVTYSGDTATARERVEDFLLLRAAQVTSQSGYTFFVFDTRDTKARTSYYSSFTGWGDRAGFGWRPFGGPYDEDGVSRPITAFDAYAEIVMLTDAEAAKEPRAIKAQSILERLGSTIASQPPAH